MWGTLLRARGSVLSVAVLLLVTITPGHAVCDTTEFLNVPRWVLNRVVADQVTGRALRSNLTHNLLQDSGAGGDGASTVANLHKRLPVITSSGSADGEGGKAFSYQTTGMDLPTHYAAEGLPPGLSANTSSGMITGTPLGAGSWAVNLSASNAAGTGSGSLSVSVEAAPCSATELGNGMECVASTSMSDTSGKPFASMTTAGSLNVQAGDSLVVAVRYESGLLTDINGEVSVQTSAGDILNYAAGVSGVGDGWATQVFYVCGAIANPASTVTVYFGSAQAYPSIIAVQYRGLAATNSCLDARATGTVGDGPEVASESFTTTQSNELSFAVGAVNATGASFSAGTGYGMVAADAAGMMATEQEAFSSPQSGVTAAMGFSGDFNGAMVVASFLAGAKQEGAGLPAGHGALVWAATSYTSNSCGGGPCVLVVTDSKGNTYTTVQTNDQPSDNVTNFLALGRINTALAGDGSDYVRCSFYAYDRVTALTGGFSYCRVLDMSNVAASGFLDSSAEADMSGTAVNSGALTVTSGNTDLIFSVYDLSTTGLTVTPGTGYVGVLNSPDQTGGTQYGEYIEAAQGGTPGITVSPGTSSAGEGVAVKESSAGGKVTSVNGEVHIGLNSAQVTVQVPPDYGLVQ